MAKAGQEKAKELFANKKLLNGYIYNLRIKVEEAVNNDILYTQVKDVGDVSWKLVNYLVEHKFDCQNRLIADDEGKDWNFTKGVIKGKKKVRNVNKKIGECVYQLTLKVEEGLSKDIYYIKIHGVDEVSWKLIDCLVKDEIVDEVKLQNQIWIKTNQESPVLGTTPGSSEKRKRSKSKSRTPQIDKSPSDCKKRLEYYDDEEDGFKIDAYINQNRCSCPQNEDFYKSRISLLEKQKLDLENEAHRDQDIIKTLKKKEKQYVELVGGYINQIRESKKTVDSRVIDVCRNCEENQQHMRRYRAQRNELRTDHEILEKKVAKLGGERNDLEHKLQKIQFENAKLVERIKSFETQISNAVPDEILCKKSRSLENTIKNQKKVIIEIQKSELDLQNALKAAEQATEETKALLEKCREEKNVVKTKLSEHEFENDRLQCEKNQLQNRLKKQKQHAAENNNNLIKEMKEKDKDIQESNQIINKLTIKLEEIERKSLDFPVRERNELIQQQKNKELLTEEIKSLKAKISELEDRLAEEKREEIEIEHKFKFEISNLRIENTRAGEKLIEAGRDYERLNSRYKEQQAILSSERFRFEEDLKELRLQLDKKSSKFIDNRWSRSASCHRENMYEMGSEGFMGRSPASLQERYNTVGSKSDTEKENISLKSELTEALENIEELKQEYKDLSERYEKEIKAAQRTVDRLQGENNSLEQDNANWKAKLDQIQSDLNRYKNEQVHEQDSSHGTIENLLQKNRKLDNDRELLRGKIFSLENDKIKLEDLLNKSKEDHNKLQRGQDELQGNLREKSNELRGSETRIRKLEADILFLQNTKTENDQLKESLREIEGVKREFENLEKRYQKETSDRMSSDNISTKYKEDNDRLRRERNDARTELQRVLKEKKESVYQHLNTEKVLAREELQNKEREKLELVALFKDKEEKDLQKIQLYEKEIETLKSRCRDESDKMRQSEHDVKTLNSRYRDDQDKIQRLEHEIYTLKSSCTDDNDQVQRMEHEIETLKSRHRDDNDKIQRMELEIETLKSKHRDDNNKMRQMEHEIETLKSRLTGEKANQYSSYEMLQNKNDLEACKHQKKALEDERNELQKENIELENELQSLNSKLEQIDDSEKNISNLKKHIKDLEEGYRNVVTNVHEAERQIQELKETVEDQKQENRDLIVNLENLDKEKKDLENKLRVMFSKDETSKLQKDNAELKHNLQNLSKQLKESENRLVLKETEQSSIIEECEELKRILQDKQRELSRLHELKDAKESSDVLRKQVQELQFEYSELNRRLEESNKENSSLRKENKKMENSLKEKLAEEKKMNARFQQYAEKFEEIPALKRHMDKVQSENTELNLKCRHLQTLEKEVQKLKKENQQLNTENISQRQNIETLNNRLEILNGEKLEIEDRLRRRSPQVVSESKSCQNCFKYRNDISDLKREINDLRDRLSEAAGNKLRDNNPNIADLSDMNRPTSLAEKFSSLYTDEYTDAMEVIEDDMDEAASVKVMLDWLKRCYEWCQRLAKEQRDTLINRSIGFMENHGGQNVVLSDRCLIFVKEFQKKIAVESLAVVGQICHVKSVTQQTLSTENYIVKYIKKCSELCWMMQISDPPLYVNFDVNSGENLNKNDYNVFTKSGSKIDYLVWPVLYLHKTGPMLAKGVAQGK